MSIVIRLDTPAKSDVVASDLGLSSSERGTGGSPQNYKAWWQNHKQNPISRKEAFEAYSNYLNEIPRKSCVSLSRRQELRRANDITSVQSKFALKYRLLSFYETRDVIEEIKPYSQQQKPDASNPPENLTPQLSNHALSLSQQQISSPVSTLTSLPQSLTSLQPNLTSSRPNIPSHYQNKSLERIAENNGADLSEISVEVELNPFYDAVDNPEISLPSSSPENKVHNNTPSTSITTATSGFGSGAVLYNGHSTPRPLNDKSPDDTGQVQVETLGESLSKLNTGHIWDIWMPPDDYFQSSSKTACLAGNGGVSKCSWCGGTGSKQCRVCKTKSKRWNSCGNCNANGSVSVQQYYNGADYDNTWNNDIPIMSGKIQVKCDDCQGVGFALEPYKCRACQGRGSVKCTKCQGQGQLVRQRSLLVQYNNHSSWAIANDSPIPHRFLHQLRGVVIWEEETAEATDSNNLDKLMDGKSATLRTRHREKLSANGRIIQQRQVLSVVPIYEVTYRVSSFWTNTFYVCGLDRKVCISETVSSCCTIL